MNPAYGILMWILIGGIAGWIASMVMGTDARQGALANIIVGVLGAVVGGFITQNLFGDNRTNNGMFASFGVALLGSIIVIAIWRAISGSGRGHIAGS